MSQRRLRTAALLGLLLLQAVPSRARRKRELALAGRPIGSISIDTHNVFDPAVDAESGRLYRAANWVHRTTRESVVRHELLFDVGDPYDPALLLETERNLKLLPFIRHARSDAVLNSSGTVDITVHTYDAWSLELVANFKRVGGVTEWKAGVTEHNLIGRGNELSAIYNQTGTVPSKTFFWKDAQVLGRRHLNYSLSADTAQDSRNFSAQVSRPFFASITRHSAGLTGAYSENIVSTYSGEALTGQVQRSASEVGAFFGVALATSTERTRRVRAGVLNRHVSFLPIGSRSPSELPAREQFVLLQLGGDWEDLDFVTEMRMQKFTHDEDYNLGLGVFPTLAWAPPLRALESSQSQVLPGLTVRKGFDWEGRLLLLRGSYTTSFVNGSNANRVAGGEATYFHANLLPRQTIALHASYDHGWRLDPSSRLMLGESNGLRGYGLSQFSGERRVLLNVEDRVFLYDEWLHLLDLGAVLFYDAGYAWGPSAPTRVNDLRHSVGVGLRVAPSRSASNSPVRIDLARALNANGTRSRWTLSILGGHAFGP